MPAIAQERNVGVTTTGDNPSIGGEATRRAVLRTRKAGLLGDAARHFCSIARPTQQDLIIFKELFYQLIDGSDASERRSLSAALSRNPYTPRTILIFLALDEPDIAAPVLMFAEALNEMDLSGIIERVGQAHLEILCRRSVLTAATARRLIAKGGERCREVLTKNLALRSDEAVQAVIATPKVTPPKKFIAPVVEPRRPAAPAPVAAAAEPVRKPPQSSIAAVSAAQRLAPQDAPVPRAAPAAARPASAVPSAPARELPRELMSLAARGGALGRTAAQQAASEAVRYDPATPFERQALRVARTKDPEAFALLANGYCGIAIAPAAGILREGGAQSICVLLKGLGLSDLGALQCLLQLDSSVARTLEAYNEAKQTLLRLQPAACHKFVTGLGAKFPQRAEPQAAHDDRQPQRRRELQPAAPAAARPAQPQKPALARR